MKLSEKQARQLYDLQMESLSDQMPRIAQPVIYMARGSADGKFPSVPRAAIVTDVLGKDKVRVCVLNPTGIFWSDTLDRGSGPGNWNFSESIMTFDDFVANLERFAEYEEGLENLQ
jgi:hypothetical protein